ncbi:uncharacterized protein LOC143293568 [Babylonia areolata]|uniref:uncharacterized protein LOC143293568 n=1 Tax=Babylonia areolata TaxID=304850 RepID=UPI003FD511C9
MLNAHILYKKAGNSSTLLDFQKDVISAMIFGDQDQTLLKMTMLFVCVDDTSLMSSHIPHRSLATKEVQSLLEERTKKGCEVLLPRLPQQTSTVSGRLFSQVPHTAFLLAIDPGLLGNRPWTD